MGRVVTLILACSIIFVISINVSNGSNIGINWSRNSRLKLLPSMVVDMLLSNGIGKVRLHSFNVGVVQAFTGSGMEIMMTLPTSDTVLVNDTSNAEAWVKENVTKAYGNYDLNVKYFVIGNEPFTVSDNFTINQQAWLDKVFYYMTHYVSQQPKPYGDIKVSIANAPDVLIDKITKPSEADFNDIVKDRMLRILGNMSTTNAPFMINIYPHMTLIEKNFPLEFGFFDNDSNFKITDGKNVYTNAFDFVFDSIVWALRKNGFGDMEIIVSQVGWPTDGHPYANASTAQRFYEGFLKKLGSDEGTPLRPGPIDVYLFNLNDENMRLITDRGPQNRHYGIYDYKGQPKFHVDLSLRGRKDVKLEPAQGVISMPRRWCVYTNETVKGNHTDLMMEQFDIACDKGDCSKLCYGASLNNLTFEGNVSYAFNSYFQSNNQDENECNFRGLAKIQLEDPSGKYGCDFPLQFLSTMFVWGQGEMGTVLATRGANAVIYKGAAVYNVVSIFSVLITIIITSFLLLTFL